MNSVEKDEAEKFLSRNFERFESSAEISRKESNETEAEFSRLLVIVSTIIFSLFSPVLLTLGNVFEEDLIIKQLLFIAQSTLFVSIICGSIDLLLIKRLHKKSSEVHQKIADTIDKFDVNNFSSKEAVEKNVDNISNLLQEDMATENSMIPLGLQIVTLLLSATLMVVVFYHLLF